MHFVTVQNVMQICNTVSLWLSDYLLNASPIFTLLKICFWSPQTPEENNSCFVLQQGVTQWRKANFKHTDILPFVDMLLFSRSAGLVALLVEMLLCPRLGSWPKYPNKYRMDRCETGTNIHGSQRMNTADALICTCHSYYIGTSIMSTLSRSLYLFVNWLDSGRWSEWWWSYRQESCQASDRCSCSFLRRPGDNFKLFVATKTTIFGQIWSFPNPNQVFFSCLN